MGPALDRLVQMALGLVTLIGLLAPIGTFLLLLVLVGFTTAVIVSMAAIPFLVIVFANCMPSNTTYLLFFFLEFYALLMAAIIGVPYDNYSPITLALVAVATHLALLTLWCVTLERFAVQLGLLGEWAGVFLGLRSGLRLVMDQVWEAFRNMYFFFVDLLTCHWNFTRLRTEALVPAIPTTGSQDLQIPDGSPPPPYIDIIVSSPASFLSKIPPPL